MLLVFDADSYPQGMPMAAPPSGVCVVDDDTEPSEGEAGDAGNAGGGSSGSKTCSRKHADGRPRPRGGKLREWWSAHHKQTRTAETQSRA